MSKQMAVRLPDEVVEFIDQEVRESRMPSRAAFVQRAFERERRRLIAARDAAILSGRSRSPHVVGRSVSSPDQEVGLSRAIQNAFDLD